MNHICHASGKVNFQIKRCAITSSQLKAAVGHNSRDGMVGQGAHIDVRRSGLNEEIIGASPQEIYLNLACRISGKEYSLDNVPQKEELRYANGRKVRTDAVLAVEVETSYPGDHIWSMYDENGEIIPVPDSVKITPQNAECFFLMPQDLDKFHKWKEATMSFILKKYGKDNVVSAHTHCDENEWHIHAIIVPVVEGKDGILTLSAKTVIGNARALAQLQTDYAKSVEHLGFIRGDYFSSRKSDYSTKEFKARVHEVLSEDIPDDLEECQEKIKNLLAKNCNLEIEMSNMKKADSVNTGLRKRVKVLEEEKYELKEQLARNQAEREEEHHKLMVYMDKAVCEEKGYELTIENNLTVNPEELVKYIKDLRQIMLRTGYEYYVEQGKALHIELVYSQDSDNQEYSDHYAKEYNTDYEEEYEEDEGDIGDDW